MDVISVEGGWPLAGAKERRRLGALLGAWEPDSATGPDNAQGPDSGPVIVDGLVAVGAPDELEFAAKAGRQTWVMVHMPVPESAGTAALAGEARALRAATGVICTSSWAASVLLQRGVVRTHIALPGVEPAAKAAGSTPPHLAVVAALLPNKDQLLAVDALARIQDLPWTASLVGSDQADPGYARAIQDAVLAHGLQERVKLTGELAGEALGAEWDRTDLSLLLSRAEAFGMVVTESLARGIPVIVRKGTGTEEALGLAGLTAADGGPRLPGAALPLPEGGQEGPARLGQALRRWLEDPEVRYGWRAAALEARLCLPDWGTTARGVLALLAERGR
ncbi:glycosyltransferase family 4 protein [Pseudarthrobacter sp. C4D7]|nr:glycosyltransferase family 4 protein [Pseudarthrobacter sp. C4D7]